MKNIEKFSFIFLVAGLISFLFAFTTLGILPALMTKKMEDVGPMPTKVPKEFKTYYKNIGEYKRALHQGKQIYIKEACWHCHSQYIRPVGNESMRYGLVSVAGEYQNELNYPHLFGTRRVGPDLIREAGKRTNDWHFAHLYNPKFTEPESVMPSYTWYFNKTEEGIKPNQDAIALVAYLQNLGRWASEINSGVYDLIEITMPPQP
jgi:cytochrome c oxidase cbb3-type subunit II